MKTEACDVMAWTTVMMSPKDHFYSLSNVIHFVFVAGTDLRLETGFLGFHDLFLSFSYISTFVLYR